MHMLSDIVSVVQTELPLAVIQEVYDGSDATEFRATLDPEDVTDIFDKVLRSPIIAIDCETTGLDYMRDQLHGFSLATATDSWYICGPALRTGLRLLRQATVSHPETLWVAHNAKFDLHFLTPHGFRPKRLADTLIAQWLVDENMELALKTLARTRLGYLTDLPEFKDLIKDAKKRLKKKKMEEVTIYDLPVHLLGEYAARDTRLTYDLWQKLVYDLDQEGQTEIFWNMEMPFVWVLLKMEQRGMFINQPAVAELEQELRQQLKEELDVWNSLAPEVNQNSTQQLGELFFNKLKLPIQDRTPKGKPKTDELTLQRLEPMDETGTVKALRSIRKTEKLLGTYIDMIREKTFEGRLHGSFNQTGTVTGRLSSSDPNLQNIPTRTELGKKVRKAFGAAPGYKLVVCDYSQIELRMLANESKEENFLKVFEEGGDPHQLTADRANVERPVGKTINFGWSYGMGPRKLCDTIEKTGLPRPKESDSRMWLDQFNDAYPTLVNWKSSVIKRARQLGYVPTLGGRKRRLPDLHHPDNYVRGGAERQCVNARIQGSCGDMIKWAMIQIDAWCDYYGAYQLCQVHDELIFEVPEDVAEEFAGIVQSIMVSIKDKYNLIVPVEADPGIGPNWGEAKG